jgi:hypothetical protein
MLIYLLKKLFWNENKYDTIDTNVNWLKGKLNKQSKDRLEKGYAVYSKKNEWRISYDIKTKQPLNEQGKGRETIIIEATCGDKKVWFHWVYCSESKKQINHWVKVFEKDKYWNFYEKGEKCYNGHHNKNKGEMFSH